MSPKNRPEKEKPTAPETLLDRFRIVLVRPKDSRNLGMIARAMTNMGLRRLVLVAPRCEIDDESYMTAVGCTEVLENSRTVGSIMEAVSDCGHVVGTTRRIGRGRTTTKSIRPLVEKWLGTAVETEVAILFGPEDHGLSTDDLKVCHDRVRIPTSDKFPSINLAQAVMLVSYELLLATLGEQPFPRSPKTASMEEQEGLFADMQKALDMLIYFGDRNPDHSMRHFRALFTRAGLTSDDVRQWRGVFARIIKRLEKE